MMFSSSVILRCVFGLIKGLTMTITDTRIKQTAAKPELAASSQTGVLELSPMAHQF
jgi:hypothetical protein